MSEPAEYAIPLFALIDRGKVDLGKPLPEDLGEQLALYLEGQFGIKALSAQTPVLDGEPYLVLHGVPEACLPPLCSLVDVQKSQLFRYERNDQDSVTLVPLNVKI